jgi:polyferredoxin
MNSLLADLILVVHFLFVAFVVGGLALIWIGATAGWRWVRNFWLRVAHLAAIAFVAGEALAGVWCPLTAWEDALRGAREEKSFVARWIHRAMFYDFPEWVFTAAYFLFALVVAATWVIVRPLPGLSKKSGAPRRP